MLGSDGFIGKTDNPIKDREGIPQGTIGFLCNQMKCFFFSLNTFAFSYFFEIVFCISHTNAFKIINHISKNYAEIIVGAGTILSTAQLEKAIESGASFGVAPGIDPYVIEESKKLNFTFAPGICTPSEIQLALKYELNLLKFFPAEYSGGLDYLKSIAAPFIQNDLKFIPLGGININTAKKYLHSNLVAAIGGSWIANSSLIVDGNWKEIEKRANEIHKLVAKVREPRL